MKVKLNLNASPKISIDVDVQPWSQSFETIRKEKFSASETKRCYY